MSPTKRPAKRPAAPARFIAVRTVAEELGVSVDTVYRMLREGVLPGVRVGSVLRVPRALLEEYLQENRIGAI
jgi:excisionase family DNA binding protein